MLIHAIATHNFMALGNVYIDMKGAPVHLFCGPNESGKSSLKDALQVAFMGTSPRIQYKKDHGQLVTDGFRKGQVKVFFSAERGAEMQEIRRNVDAEGAIHPKDFKFDDFSTACLQFVMQVRSFAEAKEDDRRRLLSELLSIKMSREDTLKRMKVDYGVADSYAAAVSPMLRSGFDAALKDATSKRSNARSSWEGATGERWGDEKVKAWTPADEGDLKLVTKEELDAARAALAECDAKIEGLVGAIASSQSSHGVSAQLTTEREYLVVLKQELPAMRTRRTRMFTELNDFQAAIDDATQRLAYIEQASHVLDCPNCNSKLRLNNNELVPVSLEDADTGAGDAVNKGMHEHALATARTGLATTQKGMIELDTKIAKARAADVRIAEIDAELAKLQIPAENNGLDALKVDLEAARAERKTTSDTFNELLQANGAVDARQKRIDTAADSVTRYFEWDKVVKALSPDGVPAKILSEAIVPLNQRLEKSAALAGWPRVQLNLAMELVRDTKEEKQRPYNLLSESAQWRASALMADAIASLSGMKMLVLDRMDVLDMEGREQCMKWLAASAETDFDTIMVFATLKGKPTSDAVKGARVHWMPEVVASQSTDK
jgi:hypothetical protein